MNVKHWALKWEVILMFIAGMISSGITQQCNNNATLTRSGIHLGDVDTTAPFCFICPGFPVNYFELGGQRLSNTAGHFINLSISALVIYDWTGLNIHYQSIEVECNALDDNDVIFRGQFFSSTPGPLNVTGAPFFVEGSEVLINCINPNERPGFDGVPQWRAPNGSAIGTVNLLGIAIFSIASVDRQQAGTYTCLVPTLLNISAAEFELVVHLGDTSNSGDGTFQPPQNALLPVLLYPIGPGFGDVIITLGDDSSFRVPFTVPFAGVLFNSVYINSNGLLSLGSSFSTSIIRSFPIMSPPLIAPFWLDLNPSVSGSTSYRYLTNTSFIDERINAFIGLNYSLYTSSSALLVTWNNVTVFGQTNIVDTFQVILTTDGNRSYVFFLYSDRFYPSGAVIGINVGDGVNFVQQISGLGSSRIAEGTNVPSLTFKGLYLYLLDVQSCAQGAIRLQGGTSTQGRVEICNNNVWGTVCDDNWDIRDAQVACRQLGFNSASAVALTTGFQDGSGQIWLNNVNCLGNETRLFDCPALPLGAHNCLHFEDAGVSCLAATSDPSMDSTHSPEVCNEGDTRVEHFTLGRSFIDSNGDFIYNLSLVVMACIGVNFGGICRQNFNNVDATLACSSLGYNYGGNVAVDQSSSYSGPIVLQDVRCTGRESSITQCNGSTAITLDCFASSNAVRTNCLINLSVVCSENGTFIDIPTEASTTPRVLPNGNVERTYTAQLAYCVNRTSYGICQRGFDDIDALVACRNILQFAQLDPYILNRAEALTDHYISNVAPLYLQNITCSGMERLLTECTSSTEVDTYCMNTSRAVGVRCFIEEIRNNTFESCTLGDLQGVNETAGQTFVDQNGNLISNTSLLLTACSGVNYGGICRRGFDEMEANLACTLLGYNYGGELAIEQSNSYGGSIYFQDVACSAAETIFNFTRCNISMTLTPECFSSDSIVKINCFTIQSLNNVREYDSCPSTATREDIIADTYKFLSSNFGVPILGLLKQTPAESCAAIRQDSPLHQSGLYWIRTDSGVQQQTCSFK